MIMDYTRAAVTKIRRDVHNLSLGASLLAQIFSICSLLYILIIGEGVFALKLTLFVVTVAYFIFYCATIAYTERRHKQLKKKVAFAFQWSRRGIKLVNLAIVLYGFVGAEHTPFSLLLFTFSALGVVLDIAIGLLSFVVEGWVQLIIDGVEYDVDKVVNAFKPANLFNKLLGKEEPQPELTPNQKVLDDIVQAEKEKKLSLKLERKSLKARTKAEKKEAKLLKKQEKQAAKLLQEETAVTDDQTEKE